MKERKIKEPTLGDLCRAIVYGIGCAWLWKVGYGFLVVGTLVTLSYLSMILLANIAYKRYQK